MRLLPATLLVGAATAAAPPMQQILQPHEETPSSSASSGSWSKPLENFQEQLKSFSDDARKLWDDVYNEFSDVMDNNPVFSLPKKHTRRPDSHWDHIVRGSEVQGLWTTGADGEKHREIDGKLEAYDLRVKKSDPSALGIDPGVKQYTGYLDDNENDKHLFYCEYNPEILYTAN